MKPSDFDKAIRSAMDADPRSDGQLARDAGLSQPTLTRFRNRDTSMSWANVVKLLAALRFRLERDQ